MSLSNCVALIASLVLGAAATASASAGVDLSVETTILQWECLKNKHAVNYAIIRNYRSNGEVDVNGANSLKLAAEVGVSDLSGYIFPCIQTSANNVENNVTCASAEQQVKDTINFLRDNGVGIARSVSSTGPIEAPHSADAVYINRLWLDIEDENPSKYFDADPAVNQAFMAAMVAELERQFVPVGIYTTLTYWEQIMDNAEGYSQYPLWYPRYDDTDSMDFFSPFAGWEAALIKQTGGDVGYCDISQVDSDYQL